MGNPLRYQGVLYIGARISEGKTPDFSDMRFIGEECIMKRLGTVLLFEIDREKRQVNFETLVSGLEIDAQIIYDFISFFYQKQLKVLFDFTKN